MERDGEVAPGRRLVPHKRPHTDPDGLNAVPPAAASCARGATELSCHSWRVVHTRGKEGHSDHQRSL